MIKSSKFLRMRFLFLKNESMQVFFGCFIKFMQMQKAQPGLGKTIYLFFQKCIALCYMSFLFFVVVFCVCL